MDNGSQALIRLENVSKVFVTDEVETHALSSVHFELKKGEYLSIAGPSGCGKSTLLAILGLLDTPSDGTYYLNGKPVTGLKLSERARIRNREIGFIFQAFNLIGDLTVYENVELPLTYRGMPSSERKRRVQDGAGAGRHVAPHEALSVATLGRSAAARRRGSRVERRPADPAGGRAYRQPGFGERRGRDEPAARAARRGFNDLHGDARSALRGFRGPDHSPVRRPHRRRERRGQALTEGQGSGRAWNPARSRAKCIHQPRGAR